MCLMLTVFAALISTVAWYLTVGRIDLHLGALSLMYWGAALMWVVDGVAAVLEGEFFLDLSAHDALLGLLVVLCGLVAWVVILLVKDPRKVLSGVGK